MTRKKQVYLFLLSLSMMILIGCGKSTSETKEVTDGSVVVQVPEGSTVESLFDFTSTAVSYTHLTLPTNSRV